VTVPTTLTAVADTVLADPVLADALAEVGSGRLPTGEITGPQAMRPFVVKGLVDADRTVLAVTATSREAEDLTAELSSLLDPETVAYYPSWETLPHERLSPRSDTVGRRLAVLRRLKHPVTPTGSGGGGGASRSDGRGPVRVVVAPVRSVLQPQVKGLADLTPVELAPGDTVELDDVVRGLVDAAYTRVDMVEKRGEFAVRGGIVDVFPPTEEHPLRVELWGDEVEEVRAFAVADQRGLEKVDRLWAPPCRELLLTDDVRRRAAELGEAHPHLLELTDKISQGIAVEGMESLAPLLVDDMELLVDLMPEDTQVLVLDPERGPRPGPPPGAAPPPPAAGPRGPAPPPPPPRRPRPRRRHGRCGRSGARSPCGRPAGRSARPHRRRRRGCRGPRRPWPRGS
jgi:transcription-repair coupling factor (superfamily II helicase)